MLGLFYTPKQDPLVPDTFLSLNVQMPTDWSQKQNRSYLFWEFGKAPEVAIEVVSNRVGKELGSKKDDYARMGIAYYAVFDPLQQLQEEDKMNGALLRVYILTANKYIESESFWLETVGLGLTLWSGEFEGQPGLWLRWCNQDDTVIPTGAEDRDRERQRAERLAEDRDRERQRAERLAEDRDRERQRAERLAEQLRAMGIAPDEL